MNEIDRKDDIALHWNAVRRIDWFLNQEGYNTLDRAEIMADLAIAEGLDPFGILVPLLNQDLTGVEEGLDRWWAESVS